MRNAFKKTVSVLMAVLMLAGLLGPLASAAEATGFEQIDSPMIYNTTDSSKLPSYPADIEDVYGQVDAADANEIDSMFSEEAMEEFSEQLDRILDFEPVDDADVAPVLGGVENFISSGALNSYLESGNLLMGSGIGLKNNRNDKVKVFGADTNANAWVFVVDKDATCFFVKDSDGMGIPKALVTISYLDDSGRRVTDSVVATDGNTPGIAAFSDIPDTFFGILDVQAEGYRAVSVLDKYMEAGERYDIVLEEAKENELYIRGVDLSGKDLVNEDTKLSLLNRDTGDLSLKVIVTRTGTAEFPESIDIYSENRGLTVLNISKTAAYDYASDTRVYVADRRWAEKSADLFHEDDQVSIKLGNAAFGLEHLTVKDAVFDPGTKDTDMPVSTDEMPGNVSDRMGGSGLINITAQILQVPVTIGFFPDGNVIIMASYDITKLDKNTQYKYSSLFDKSWNPKTLSNSEPAFQTFQRSFWENAEKVKGGKEVLNSKDKLKCLTNKTYDFSMSFSVFLRTCYNKETGDNYGTGGIIFCGSLTGGITEYFLFPIGPVVIPAYIGFEAGFKINTALNICFETDKPPAGQESDTKWRYANNGETDVSARIEVIVSFAVFGGVGVKGVLGASATGYANLDIAAVLGGGGDGVFSDDPHSFIDALWGLRFDYYLLFFSGTINIESLNGAKRLYDSRGEYDLMLNDGLLTDIDFKDIDLKACADTLVPAVGDSGGQHDQFFMTEDESAMLGSNSNIVSIDSSTYPDTQIQFAATRNYTVLFRLASNGMRTDIYYQLQNRVDGNLYSGLYRVELPDGETRSVSEFVAVPNKTDWDDPDYCDMVYIGAILADDTLKDEGERIRSTDVAAIVVNLDGCLTASSVIASDQSSKGQYLYSAPRPAGREDYCSVAFAATTLKDSSGESVNTLKTLMGTVPTRTEYWISYREDKDPAVRSYRAIGSNKVHSSGVIAPNEPSFWVVDPIRSSDKYLVVRGYGSNGYYAEDLRCNFRIDIDGMIDIADIRNGTANYDGIISNWQYLNGCNYFIAGDSVYWMDKKTKGNNPADYEWVVEKADNGSGVISVDNRYAMITNNNQSAVYLIGVIEDYDVDVEAGTSAKGANRALIYTLTTDKNWVTDKLECTLHGPLVLKFAGGDPITCFTAAYNPDECKASGLSIAYSTPAGEGSSYACSLRMWKQNADSGLLVTDLKIPDYLVREGQPVIDLYVTVRNYGYGRENPVPYVVYDENGVTLTQCVGGRDVREEFYTGKDLYTGDSRVDNIQVRPNPNWSTNEEHEIVVEVKDSYRYKGDLDDVVNSARMTADNTSLTAENDLVGGRHVISTQITNNTFVGEKQPVLKVVLDYGEKGPGRTLKFELPEVGQLSRFDSDDAETVDQVYNYDIDMDGIWKDGLSSGLTGAYVSLVDRAGEQQSNEQVYVPNPLGRTTTVSKPYFADVDSLAWYGVAVGYVSERGIMKGVGSNRFDPAGPTTRAMVVTILNRLEGSPAVDSGNPFDDVEDGAWYTDAIVWAADNGLVEGYGNGKFGPTDPITREQLAAMLWRYAKYKGYDVSVGEDTNIISYDDFGQISKWAVPAMQWAVGAGLINGRTESTLVPQGNATRAETAMIIMRFMENLK
ncbi:MAG: S-layer homology domain-containing protein [Oscillospiraceae bacterium]|nr:S-layer homology domain-containing protein [Oscillospiraceae bacterium]